MARYTAVNDLDRHLGRFKSDITDTSRPGLVELEDFITEVEDEIDVSLVGVGATVPISAPPELVRWIRDTVAIEASSRVLGTLLPQAAGTLSTSRPEVLHQLYLERMKRLEANGIAEITVISAGGSRPRSYWTTNPVDASTGELNEPVFGMHTKW